MGKLYNSSNIKNTISISTSNSTSNSRKKEKFENDTENAEDISFKNENESYEEIYNENLLDGNESKEDLDEQKSSKRIRHRKRKLYNQVREQMEFYFSDANLSKDRYLMQMVREDPYVPLDVFLNFNKIKKIIKASSELVKALSSSLLLELNDEKTRVTRIKPIKDSDTNHEDTDNRTIYVESLPANADHEWVKKVFTHVSNGGNVTYVSLPRYKNSKKLKEFGFVEFDTIESAQKCIKTFKEFDGLLHHEILDPIQLISIKSFIKEQNCSTEDNEKQSIKKEKYSHEKKDDNNEHQQDKNMVVDNNDSNNDVINIEDNDNVEPKSKKLKLNKIEEINNSQSDIGSCEATESDRELNESDNLKRKKLRKKKKKDKKKKTIENPKASSDSRPLNLDIDLKDLKILPKREWKRLRNKYLNLQREKINVLKKKSWQKSNENSKGNFNKKQVAAVKHIGRLNQQIAASSSLHQQQLTKSTQNTTSSSTTTPQTLTVPNVKNFDLKKSPHMNFYRVNKEIDGGLYDEEENDSQSNDTSSLDSPNICSPYSILEKRRKLLSPITNSTKTEIKRNVALEKGPLFQFVPGIIIKIELAEPCIDTKQFKIDIKHINDSIKYIDVKEGTMISYLRFDTAKNAQIFLTKLKKDSYKNCEVLDGTEESKYWDKIMEDREMKLNKRIKIKNKRGREKIPKLIANHIRFVDDEE